MAGDHIKSIISIAITIRSQKLNQGYNFSFTMHYTSYIGSIQKHSSYIDEYDKTYSTFWSSCFFLYNLANKLKTSAIINIKAYLLTTNIKIQLVCKHLE